VALDGYRPVANQVSIHREQREVGFQPNPILLFNFSTGVDLEVFNVHHATLLQFGCGL
jgi:hypothetical protein